MMKKSLALLLSSVFLVTLMAGCGSSKAPDSSSTKDTGTNKTEVTAGADKKSVELTLWVTSRKQDDFSNQIEAEFLEKNPHITLNKIVKEGDPGNLFYQAVAAGNAPDFIDASFTVTDQYMRAGILEPLNTYLDQWDEWSNFSKEYVDMFSLDSKVYGVPNSISPMLFGYNKSLFANAGIANPPKTWDEALEAAKKLTDPANQVAGYATLVAEWTEWFFQYYVWQAGGDLTKQNADGTLELTFTDPAVIEAANYYKKLRAEKVLQSDLTLKFGDLVDKFAQGKIAMMPFAGDWVSDAVNKGMNPDDIGLILPPAGPSGESKTAIAGINWVINAKTTQEKKDASWEYIKFKLSKDIMVRDLDDKASKGANNPVIIPRSDIVITEHYDFPKEYVEVLDNVKSAGRLEFYGKADLASYVDRAVQKVIVDPNADPMKEFEAAQEQAAKEVLERFNAQAKK